jgi:leucyl/phenylalanyl-tRNA--protein transferase
MVLLDNKLWFPSVDAATQDGLLAFGGDLSPERLLLAYQNGIFPWYNPGEPIMWWSPPTRMVVDPYNYKTAKTLASFMKKMPFNITWNQEFESVITACQKNVRRGQTGTWITDELLDSFLELNAIGVAKSVEVWNNDTLVGGLYGIDLGHIFCGESMFSIESNASKVAFVWLIDHLKKKNYQLLDCQMYNEHLALLGAFEITRDEFTDILSSRTVSL